VTSAFGEGHGGDLLDPAGSISKVAPVPFAEALMTKLLAGGCQCGAARYEIAGPVLSIYVCYCRECRKQSASAFGISVAVKSADVRLTQGKLASWTRATDSGGTLTCFFCPTCGTRVWHGDKDRETRVSVKGGSLDEPVDLTHARHIWTTRKLPGIIIPENAEQWPLEPD
jgi:hypothetical protein